MRERSDGTIAPLAERAHPEVLSYAGRRQPGEPPQPRWRFLKIGRPSIMEWIGAAAILLVLFAMLDSALPHRQAGLRQVLCMSNLRQIAVALQLYASSNNGV